MKMPKYACGSPARRTMRLLRLLLFLSPLPALPHLVRHFFPAKPELPSVVLQASPSQDLLSEVSDGKDSGAEAVAIRGLEKPHSLSILTGDVEVPVGNVPIYFWGVPMHHLSDAVRAHPHARRFHLYWCVVGPGCVDNYTVWYDRKKQTLRQWHYGTELEMPSRRDWTVYRKVNDSMIINIAAKDPSLHKGVIEDLTDYGCICRGAECPEK